MKKLLVWMLLAFAHTAAATWCFTVNPWLGVGYVAVVCWCIYTLRDEVIEGLINW